uniref:Uncharacterized protein n=1 Tax=Globodera rostochiensis TaxID=31243 RepID=A0A914H9A2_GLORO
MVGLFQLLIFLCSTSKILTVEVEILFKGLPWELRLRQECKEEAQIVCKECGWAQCVPTDAEDKKFDPNYECCPNVRKEHKGYCCPMGYEFKCCAVLPQQKYALQPTFIPETIKEFEKKCKNSKICICALTSDGLMSGLCCDQSFDCGCCRTDPTISKIPALVRDTATETLCKTELTAKALGKKGAIICRTELGNPATDCCDEGHKLEFVDEVNKNDLNLTIWVPTRRGQHACQNQIDEEARRHLRAHCVWAEGRKASKCCPENYKLKIRGDPIFCPVLPINDAVKLLGNLVTERWYNGEPAVFNSIIDTSLPCGVTWYWAVHPIPELTSTYGPVGRSYTWMGVKTAEMVRALDESSDCKQKEVYCACGALHFDQIMNGMCCDSDTSCACCSKDPTISKLPTWVRKPRQVQECKDQMLIELGGQEQKTEAFCLWSEGWKDESKCCGGDYQLVLIDQRYAEHKIRVAETPFAVAIRGFDRHHPFLVLGPISEANGRIVAKTISADAFTAFAGCKCPQRSATARPNFFSSIFIFLQFNGP